MTALNSGNGSFGDAVANGNYNLSTQSLVGRGVPDMPSFAVSSLSSNLCVVTTNPSSSVAYGDLMILMNVRGVFGAETNIGNWEIIEVDSVSGGNTINFKTNKTKFYGAPNNDTLIGNGIGYNHVTITRIPQYNNLTINSGSSITGNNWDGWKGGLLTLMVKGTLINNGTIHMNEKGFIGALNKAGESITGQDTNWGSGQIYSYSITTRRAGGGGYGTAGMDGYTSSGGGHGGDAYGSTNLWSKIYMGGAGGAKGQGGAGGGGCSGGMVMLFATTIENYGNIQSRGQRCNPCGDYYAPGNGSGGAIMIQGGSVKFAGGTSTISPYQDPYGKGRTAVYYNYVDGTFNNFDPVPYTSNNVTLPYRLSGTVDGASEIRIYDSGWGLITSGMFSDGGWAIENLPGPGPYYVVSDPNATDENIAGFKSVTAVQ